MRVVLNSSDPMDPAAIVLTIKPYSGAIEPELKKINGWKLICVTSEQFKRWMRNSLINCQYDFTPGQPRLDRLSRIFQGQAEDSGIEVSWVKMLGDNSFEFQDGRHRAWWIALRDPEFVPLLVPAFQHARFETFFKS
ncbi:hypothetical protein [Massilia rubra]|uniref:Uncharacterized protein n=1 Tax=Massilia rubra TaxID=2607910 RepID=A0ABX0LF14_9BURK|nr:hypothetical protein [Massilia rubra]NHZ33299.1 hypothetical protein [Massilia rubra]